jgi:valyl-tRNA synthetase
MSALMKRKELLESKSDTEILRQLPSVYSKEWDIPLPVARRETKEVEIQHVRNLRKSMGWLPPPNSAAYNKIMAERKAHELELKAKHLQEMRERDRVTQEKKPEPAVATEGNGSRHLVLSSDLHDTLKRAVSLIKRMEEREETILELLEEVTTRMKKQQLVPREKAHPVLGVSKQQVHRLLGS